MRRSSIGEVTQISVPVIVQDAVAPAVLPLAGSAWGARAMLILLCVSLYLPGLTVIPVVDRDEARFAQATKQMLEGGDFVRPHFQSSDRFKKPIGIYWLQAASVAVAGRQARGAIWAYRLPSLVGAIVAVLLTEWIGRRLFNRQVALLGAALLGSSMLLTVEAHLATTDAVLLACVIGAQACLAALYMAAWRGTSGSAATAAGFWIAQGLGILLKGPVVALVSGLTVASLIAVDRRGRRAAAVAWFRTLRTGWGILLALAIVLPWLVAIGVATNGRFLNEWIGGDLVTKLLGGQESHGAPPGYYLLLSVVTFWSGSLVMGLAVVRGVRRRARLGERFCLAWLIPMWIVCEAMPTKLPHYVLPAYPALALLAARAVLAFQRRGFSVMRSRWIRAGVAGWGVLTLALGAAILVASRQFGGGVGITAIFVLITASTIAATCVRLCWQGRPARASWAAVAGSVVLSASFFQLILPRLDALWLSRAAANAVATQSVGVSAPRPLVAVGYQEPSLVFEAGTDVAFAEAADAAHRLARRRDSLVLVDAVQREAFVRAADAVGVRPREVWSVDGINYSKGRWIRLHLFDLP